MSPQTASTSGQVSSSLRPSPTDLERQAFTLELLLAMLLSAGFVICAWMVLA